jgi:hypothetical protein
MGKASICPTSNAIPDTQVKANFSDISRGKCCLLLQDITVSVTKVASRREGWSIGP